MSRSNVREAALDVLLKVEKNQAYSHLLLNQTMNSHRITGKDAGLFTEIVYGTIQRQKTIDYFLSPFVKKPLAKLDGWVHLLLRMTVYQTVYLDRVPERAAFHEAVQIAKKRGHKGIAGMVNGVLRSLQREGLPSFDDISDPIKRIAVEYSHPEWLVARWAEQFGQEKAARICRANLEHPEQTARVNLTKSSVENAAEMMREEGLEVSAGGLVPEALTVSQGAIARSRAFQDGAVSIQDESSMLVARALGAGEGETVLDACAAPGGKSSHIAETMNNRGKIESLDIHQHKVQLIEEQKNRLGLTIIHPRVLDARKAGGVFAEDTFDKILVDAPCSGLGVIKRKPDLKWSKKEEDISRLGEIQLDILKSVWPLLKPGGTLVYSTCTVDKEENSRVSSEFYAHTDNAVKDAEMKNRLPEKLRDRCQDGAELALFPDDYGTDGFYIHSFRKKES
ncbi:16S rRNA (cytosine(967)-C(5))-methyltransferase RsmB [Alteribacter natronophilus]|uniref:16S rRNA (cytosine(967)-C(5))-methyltransferase RsmB n=1 Tax=Alteribacter natronophilus TaxID=2583810 RepID=UPI00110D7FB5|nr:16S rRNA (cytosine(967)-C(5))-methyltransferase RsmB [Alteribacter natronophilus]TMW73168.1 16S rRNA (cytosine(967)-C(5))-methyltransferase RsmB [Alteribacter natronophilus]